MSAPLVFLDTETTGLHHGRRAWDVGLIRRREGHADQEWQAYVRLDDLDLPSAEAYALDVGKFYERHPAHRALTESEQRDRSVRLAADREGGPSFTERHVAVMVERLTRGAVLVGSNVAFDAEVLRAMLHRHGLRPAWAYRVIDVAALGAGWLAQHAAEREESGASTAAPTDPNDEVWQALRPPWSSERLATLCGVEPAPEEERHSALGDARWVLRWWDALGGLQSVAHEL